MAELSSARRFPCPVCAMPQEVRSSKKEKPYITCNTCGVQVFVRGRVGIEAFDRLLNRASLESTFARVNEMIRRYHVKCDGCGTQFWVEPGLIETSLFDGSLKGVRCPNAECRAVVPWKQVA